MQVDSPQGGKSESAQNLSGPPLSNMSAIPPSDPSPTGLSFRNRNSSQSQSIADLPSALSEIFHKNVMSTRERLKLMKPLTKSCADLRSVTSDELRSKDNQGSFETSPSKISESFSSANSCSDNSPNSSFGCGFNKELRLHQFPTEYLASTAGPGSHQYKTIHSIPQSEYIPVTSPLSRKPPLTYPSFRRANSFSDTSEDESFAHGSLLNSYNYKPRKSPTRTSPPSRSSFFTDDPSRLLKAKLKHTHSLSNLPEVLHNETLTDEKSVFNPVLTPLHSVQTRIAIGSTPDYYHTGRPHIYDSAYHTIHAGNNPTTSRFTNFPMTHQHFGTHFDSEQGFSHKSHSRKHLNEIDLERFEGLPDLLLEESSEELTETYGQHSATYSYGDRDRVKAQSSGLRPNDFSLRYGSYSHPYATISSHTDPSLAKLIRERERERLRQRIWHSREGDADSDVPAHFECDHEYYELLERQKCEKEDMKRRHRQEHDLFLMRKNARLGSLSSQPQQVHAPTQYLHHLNTPFVHQGFQYHGGHAFVPTGNKYSIADPYLAAQHQAYLQFHSNAQVRSSTQTQQFPLFQQQVYQQQQQHSQNGSIPSTMVPSSRNSPSGNFASPVPNSDVTQAASPELTASFKSGAASSPDTPTRPASLDISSPQQKSQPKYRQEGTTDVPTTYSTGPPPYSPLRPMFTNRGMEGQQNYSGFPGYYIPSNLIGMQPVIQHGGGVRIYQGSLQAGTMVYPPGPWASPNPNLHVVGPGPPLSHPSSTSTPPLNLLTSAQNTSKIDDSFVNSNTCNPR